MLRLGKSRFFTVRFENEYEVQVPSSNSKLCVLKYENIQNQPVMSKLDEKRICRMKEVSVIISAYRYADIHHLKSFATSYMLLNCI